jgi:HPt (histidine-containing phosphotransfer) domain-containing protein
MSDTPNQDLDLTFLNEIADGSDEFIVESIDMLLIQAPESLGNIEASIQSRDWAAAAAEAHKLKPSAGFFGMLISQELLLEIEQLCKAGGQDPDKITAKFNQAKELIGDNLKSLTRLKEEKQAGL